MTLYSRYALAEMIRQVSLRLNSKYILLRTEMFVLTDERTITEKQPIVLVYIKTLLLDRELTSFLI